MCALPDGVVLIGFVSNFRDYKRPLEFVRIAQRIVREWRGSKVPHFVMMGREHDITERQILAEARHLGIGDRFHLLGFVLDAERLMAGLDALVIPAVGEPFGRTPVEASLVEVPFVASDSGGHKESTPEGLSGRLVRSDAVDAFALAIIQLLSDRETPRKARELRAINEKRFSTDQHVSSIVRLYDELLREPV
ncbi:glycosyltransferase family 4 protein [Rhabdothermincola salaria]|uniref:glycosyltransferase family 4 protein n=1 Tax=Rhabdothermincola salaria TaxID=2903142 RepID=UPI001E56625C|nr:glycosyltransferase family 4 protein [Rhabdothermincola salaria]MCD9622759.1 glycosyltransferase family 4 protein [Rhabdothermincola salaria]